MLNRGPHLASPKERNRAQPTLLDNYNYIGRFENAE
jgi:hypothetical protein